MTAVALFLMGSGTSVQAITAQGDVQANIITSLSFSKIDTLDFGSVMSDASGSVVRVAPVTGARTLVSGTGTLVTGGSENDGTFTLGGVPGMNMFIDIPTSATVSYGVNSMTVNNFIWSYDGSTPSSADGPAALNMGGSATLSVGADLTVGANQPAGLYTGTYSVTVNYQ